MILLIESALVILAFAIALFAPSVAQSWFQPIECSTSRLARRKSLAVATVGAAALLLRLMLLPVVSIPDPAVHDEFSYLLAADTLAHGRLTNPTHPMWRHFETFHVIQRPTYASMYYPAQGMFLAFGEVVLGHPFWGVWLSSGLMCAGICWMLQGWLPPLWAFFGGLLAVIRLGTFSYWANSYWGGAVAAIGGALVLGALPRIKRKQRFRDAVLLGAGFALIANSRPYEGLFFATPIIVALLFWTVKGHIPASTFFIRIALPLIFVLALTLAGMGYYFWRVTGSPVKTPFSVNIATYNPVPYFPWQSLRPAPSYLHATMHKFYLDWWLHQYDLGRSHPVILALLKIGLFWVFFVGPLFTLPLLGMCFAARWGISFRELRRSTRFLLIILASILLGALLPVYFNPHYVAPAACAIYALVLIAMQRIRHWSLRGRPTGIAIIRAVSLIAIMMLLVRIGTPLARANDLVQTWYSPIILHTYRAEVASRLCSTPGKHLVIVRYSPAHNPVNEWVFNSADIDDSKIVWARDMGAENLELIRYFRDRDVWIIHPDEIPPHLSAYAESDTTGIGRFERDMR